MRVAMITPYWHPVRGGVTTFVSRLTDALRNRGDVEIQVLAREGSSPGAVCLGGTPREFAARAVAELERFGPAVVHAHGHWYALLAGVRYRKRRPHARLVFTVHTEFPRLSAVRRRLLRNLLERADYVTTVSEDLFRRTIPTLRPSTRTRITRPGAQARELGPDEVAAFLEDSGLVDRKPLVAFVGPLAYREKSRGVSLLIDAMRVVRRRHPEAMLAIAGDGPYRSELEAHAARTLPGGCAFLGSLDDPAALVAAADVYAHVSFQEGLPLALLEAMALGTPIVATAAGGIPEVLRDGKNGTLVSGDAEAIAKAILNLTANPENARHLAEAARSDAETRFSWNAASESFVPLYGGRSKTRVAVTVDLEQDYPASPRTYQGVKQGLPRILDALARHGVRADFFVTSDLCERFPSALREIALEGHRIGCHGASHEVAYYSEKSASWQLDAIRSATEAIAECTGVRPTGFRAPNFSTNGDTIAVLGHLGYRYDSSVLPGRIVRRKRIRTILNFMNAPRDAYRPSTANPGWPGMSPLVEIPVTENPFLPGSPIGLGFLNSRGVDATFEAIETSAGSPCVFLIHPWELLDPPVAGPAWMRTGCKADPANLDAFLARLIAHYELTTLDDEAHRFLEGRSDHRRDVPAKPSPSVASAV